MSYTTITSRGWVYTLLRKCGVFSLLLVCLGTALAYQYDPTDRLRYLNAKYPGGVTALYQVCADKFSKKIEYLQSLGVSYPNEVLNQNRYTFLVQCIYGQSEYAQSICLGQANGCQPVTLPITPQDLSQKKQSMPSVSVAVQGNADTFLANIY